MLHRYTRLLLLALLVEAVAAGASAATCVALSSGTWGPVDAGTAQWSCGAPTAADSFRIPDGVSVTLVDDVVQDGATPSHLVVEPGGALSAAVDGSTGSIDLTLGAWGLLCRGDCSFTGGYRSFDASPARLLPPSALADAVWRVGELVPCRDGDCTSDAHVMRIRYPEHPKTRASLAAVEPGRDVVCFWDPDPGDVRASPESNQCYEVVATAAPVGGPASLDLDVRQGDRNQHGYPLARRRLREVELAAPLGVGERWLTLTPASIGPGLGGRFVGRWLRFPDGSGAAEPVAQKILRVVEGGGSNEDRIQLGDWRGAAAARPAGARAWIGYGFRSGDPMLVMAPVRVGSATAASQDSSVSFEGVADLTAVVFDDVRFVGASGTDFALRQYWIQDATNLGGSALYVHDTTGAVIERGCHTGGDETAQGDRTHTLFTPGNTDLTVSDVSVRYHGDDAISMGAATAQGTMRRVHVAMRSERALTCNCLSAEEGHPHRLVLEDFVCDDATDQNANFQMVIGPGGAASLDGALVWGGRGGTVNGVTPSRLTVRDLLVMGLDTAAGQAFLPQDTERFVIRDVAHPLPNGPGFCVVDPGSTWSFRDGLVLDSLLGNESFCRIASGSSGVLENVALVNVDSSHPLCGGGGTPSCGAVVVEDPAGVDVRDVTLAWQDGVQTSLSHGLRVLGAVPSVGDLVLDGLLVHGLHGSGANPALATVDAATIFDPFVPGSPVDGPCLFSNDVDGNADFEAHAPASTTRGLDPGFVDLAAHRVDTAPGSAADAAGCGVRRGVDAPGIRGYHWMHAVSGIVPERFADDADGDGVPVDPGAPTCPDGQSTGCSDACPLDFDPEQRDSDGDGIGDACDLACSDGEDDDGDGLVDHPEDPGCDAPTDDTETSPALPCDDGLDGDGDGLADAADPGCAWAAAPSEEPECDDGLDNDGDLAIDADDPDCAAPHDAAERPTGGACGLLGAEALGLAALGRLRRRAG